MHPASKPIKVSFSFYPADMAALADRENGLNQTGVPVRGATVLRALIDLTPSAEMFAHSVLLAAAYGRKDGPREDENVTGHPTVDLPKDQVKKLDDVVRDLDRKNVIATRAFVVRAILRASPDGKTLAPAVKKFLADHPNKPRGLPAALKARRARG